jgi:hypothetical protein
VSAHSHGAARQCSGGKCKGQMEDVVHDHVCSCNCGCSFSKRGVLYFVAKLCFCVTIVEICFLIVCCIMDWTQSCNNRLRKPD